MSYLVVDIETDGLLREDEKDGKPVRKLTQIHCICTRDAEDRVTEYGPAQIPEALDAISAAPLVVGHNLNGYDFPAIKMLFPSFHFAGKVRDTLTIGRILWPEIKVQDFGMLRRRPDFPKAMIGKYSLEAWGYRLRVFKGKYGKTADWSAWSPEMQAYCVQDTHVTKVLWDKLLTHYCPESAIELEQAFSMVLDRQMLHGVEFNKAGADALVQVLQGRRAELDAAIKAVCGNFEDKYVTPKKKIEKTRVTEFNPASRDHVARHFVQRCGWKPQAFTGEGKAQVEEEILKAMPWPEAKLLADRFTVAKRLGMLTEGREAWVKKVKSDGRIHGYINHNGAVTTRCTHSGPNLSQVPRVGSLYGSECRALFTAPQGRVLVGADASGLELRVFAHYLARFDGGKYAKVLLEGDIHTANQEAAGLATRDQAKTFIYGLLYGAGDGKLGEISGQGEAHGRRMRTLFERAVPAYKLLKQAIDDTVQRKHYLLALDGRRLVVRHRHAALNTLLQAAGSISMKKAVVLTDARACDIDPTAFQVLMSHDEMQYEANPSTAEALGKAECQSIADAGAFFNLRCPLEGKYKVGQNWSDTH